MRKKLFEGRDKGKSRAASVQTVRNSPYSAFYDTLPLGGNEQEMFDNLREAVPIIDAAIDKILRLVGGIEVKCRNTEGKKILDELFKTVKVGASSTGIDAFIYQYLDRLLTWGTAVCEIVPYKSGRIAALYCADNRDLEIQRGKNPLDINICTRNGGELIPLPHPERICLTALNPMPGEIKGCSILKCLPFVSSVLLKIYSCIGTNWERAGNIRYAVTYKPPGGIIESALSGSDTLSQISEEWSKAMSGGEDVRDFIAVGDVEIKVIGADNLILDSEIPARQMLEQIVAKMGIPPFMLGLSWSSTERMSQQQADILTSELESYRKLITPVIEKICRVELRAEGIYEAPEVVWSDISLQDEVEQAKAMLYKAQAKQKAD